MDNYVDNPLTIVGVVVFFNRNEYFLLWKKMDCFTLSFW